MSFPDDRDQLLANADLADLLEEIGSARGLCSRGRQYPCPSADHNQTGDTPPVSISPDARGYDVWKCHSCKAGGSAIDALLVSGEVPDLAGAFEALGGRKRSPDRPVAAGTQRPRHETHSSEPSAWPEPVAARLRDVKGWTVPTLERLGVTWDLRSRRVSIPVVDEEGNPAGTLRYLPNAASRNQNKMLADRGTSRDLFPPPESIEGDEVWIVEGEPDAISAHELTLPGCGVPGVESWKPGWARRFARFKRAFVLVDCDEQGRRLGRRVAADVAEQGPEVRIVDFDGERTDKYDVGDALVEAADPAVLLALLRKLAEETEPISPQQAAMERAATRAESAGLPLRIKDGADVIAAADTHVPAVWGAHPYVLWAKGEPFMMAGSTGTGKTSVAQQLVLRRIGAIEGRLLDQVVEVSERPVLYLAIDRDKQAQRSIRRMIEIVPRGRLLWHADLGAYDPRKSAPEQFVEWLGIHRVGTLVIDSLYGLIGQGKDDALVDWYMRTLRTLADASIEVLVLHHFRKQGGKDDVSMIERVAGAAGMTWSAGSVLAISGNPGDSEVEAYHVKQPAKMCGPWTLVHDHEHGITSAKKHPSVVEFLKLTGSATLDEIIDACYLTGSKKACKAHLNTLVKAETLDLDGGDYTLKGEKLPGADEQTDDQPPSRLELTDKEKDGWGF